MSDIPMACRMCPVCVSARGQGVRRGDICDRIVGHFLKQTTIANTVCLRDPGIPKHRAFRDLMGPRK